MIPIRRIAGAALLAAGLLASPANVLRAAIEEGFVEEHINRLERVFTALDPSHPETGPLRGMWEAGESLAAARQLAAYFGNKSFPVEVLEPLLFPADLIQRAEAALDYRFFLLDEWERVARRPGGGPDWRDRGQRGDKERAWMLNRHDFLPDLAEAHRQTGDTRFREHLNALLTDWILANPYPDRLTFSAPWRALEVARRVLNSWIHVFYGYAVLDPETRLLVLSSVLDHADALREHTSFWGGNHLISEKLALLTLAGAWPELEPAGEWQRHAVDAVAREYLEQTYPDGSYKELSNHYQRVVLVNAQYFLRLMDWLDPSYRQQPVVDRIETMWDFFAGVMRPDGSGPLNNASDREINAAFLLDAWESFDRPDWRYIATRGRKGTPPAGSPSRLFPWAGQAILRSGWEREAHWLYFDAGPYGSAHQHVDRFHVSASLHGRPLLTDTGRYTYQPGPWRDYFKGPAGQNTLLLDGFPAQQAPRKVNKPLKIAFETRAGVSFAAARSAFTPGTQTPFTAPLSLRGAVPWTRAVLLDTRGFILIADHLITFSEQSLLARWHFDPAVSASESQSALRLVSSVALEAETVVGQGPPDIGGFHSPDYNRRLPAPERRFEFTVQGPTTLLWLLQSPGEPPVQIEILSPRGAPVLEFQIRKAEEILAEGALQLHPQPQLLNYVVSGWN